MNTFQLTFLGATGTVTGSRYLVEVEGSRILVDCGLFQGYKQLRLRNWATFPVRPDSVDAVVLTHAHLDHSGYLPLLVKNGYTGPVHCTGSTQELCEILLPDSGFLQEKEAEYANRHKSSKHDPALPLYTVLDAEKALKRFRPCPFHVPRKLHGGSTAEFHRAGHILGAAIVKLRIGDRTLVFSGDLGRPGSKTMVDPETIKEADYLVVESTYGDRRHPEDDPEVALEHVITQTVARGGTVLIPAFAVGRTQTLLYHLERLISSGRIPRVPVFVDSPMATDATEIFRRNHEDHRLSIEDARRACGIATYTHAVEESKALNANPSPKIIISASGMATGGRVLHHLRELAPGQRNTILFSGYQAGGTRGAALVGGAKEVVIFGQPVPVRAQVANLDMLSAHADADEILAWLRRFSRPPRMTFITHGEPAAADVLRYRIEHELRWPVTIPEYKEQFELD